MATVSYTGIADNDPRGVAGINAIWAAFQAQSTNVTAANWRDEGLDQRVLASGAAVDGFDRVENDQATRYYNVSTTPFAVLVLGARTFQLTNGGAGWQTGQNVGVVRVRFATEFEYTYGASPAPLLQFRLAYQIDGGAWTYVPKSARGFSADAAVAANYDPLVSVLVDRYRDNFKYAFLIPYPADGAAHTLNGLRVEAQIAGGATYRIGATTLQAMRFVKAVST